MNRAAPSLRAYTPGMAKVALLVSEVIGYSDAVMRGVCAYARPHRPWLFHTGPLGEGILRRLREWRPDGIIARVLDEAMADALLAFGVPVVNVSAARAGLDGRLPRVGLDDRAIGAMAARFFAECGLRQVGFCGYRGTLFSDEREAGLRRAAADLGLNAHCCEDDLADYGRSPSDRSWATEWQKLEAWATTLPRPIGVLAANDFIGLDLCQVCHRLGIGVPQEVAVLGVDNMQTLCELTTPALASIETGAERVGYAAAELLDRLMAAADYPRADLPLRVPPVRVVRRLSADILAIRHPDLAAATRYIRDHATEQIGVTDILRHVPISRRSLEQGMRAVLGRSPLQEIRRVQIEEARRLLSQTALPIAQVAERCGFLSAERMATVFRRATGCTPREYRAEHRPAVNAFVFGPFEEQEQPVRG
jgi:LacI family transcriptional regulator